MSGSSVVYRGSNGHIYRLSLPLDGGGWQLSDLSAVTNAPLAVGDPAAYRRPDGVKSVVYRSSNGHLYELYLREDGAGGWQIGDLSALTNAPLAAGGPAANWRGGEFSDRLSSVVYRGSNGHLYELYLRKDGAGGWQVGDLSGLTNAPAAAGDPIVYQDDWRGLGACVIYRGSSGYFYELSWQAGGAGWMVKKIWP